MQDIFNKLEFRSFSYEEDSEAVADMHCCAEILEGSWFDRSDTCKMHAKVVARSPGSSWVVAYGSVIFAHADLIKTSTQEASVLGWRLHENFRYPQVARMLFEGLCREARKREYTEMVIYADNSRVDEELVMLGMQPDRRYQYADPSSAGNSRILRSQRVVLNSDDVSQMPLTKFLGLPLPPAYILQKAYMGADYAVFKHSKPSTFEIYHNDHTYLACHDGREWHIFRQGDFKAEKEIISPLLKTIASLQSGHIMLSDKAAEAAELIPINDGVYHDYYTAI